MAKRILIADDSVTIQKAFAMTFAGADDVTVTGARSADEGLALAQRAHPDLIIADGVMPGRSGYDLCASVKATPRCARCRSTSWRRPSSPTTTPAARRRAPTGQLTKPWDTTAMMDGRATRAPEESRRALPAAGSRASPRPHQRGVDAAVAIDEDEYGEISIDSGRDAAPEPQARPRVLTPPPPAPVGLPPGRMTNTAMPAAAPSGPAPGCALR